MALAPRSREVVILGAGIAGMLAGWATHRAGRSFVILDQGPKEALPRLVKGCVYLHDRCDLPMGALVEQLLYTTVLPCQASETPWRLYHQKIWGSAVPYVTNSVHYLLTHNPLAHTPVRIYSMNHTLAWLHHRLANRLHISRVTWTDVQEWLGAGCQVISTIPLKALFPDVALQSQPFYIFQAEDSTDHHKKNATAYTIYNVVPEIPWVRMSSMFGYFSMEFVTRPVGWEVADYHKIISVDMAPYDALHPHLLFTGRWGRWQRGFLSHQTYATVKSLYETEQW